MCYRCVLIDKNNYIIHCQMFIGSEYSSRISCPAALNKQLSGSCKSPKYVSMYKISYLKVIKLLPFFASALTLSGSIYANELIYAGNHISNDREPVTLECVKLGDAYLCCSGGECILYEN